MLKITVIVIFMFFINSKCCELKPDELLSVVAIFRHGDKTPKQEYFDVYPNNPWKNPRLWNGSDMGSVTMKGKINMYERGKWLRDRYKTFLPGKYSDRMIYIRSSDSDRVLVSAQLLLAGLYPPVTSDIWHNKISWQPIPVHSVPEKDDMVVAQKTSCPAFTKLLNEVLTSNAYRYDNVKYLETFIGRQFTSIEDVYKLYKLLKIVDENGLVVPNWAANAMPVLGNMTNLISKTYAMTPPMQRFKSGPFFHKMLTHFDSVLNPLETGVRMMLFAGHSRSLSNILMTLQAHRDLPPYTATLLFELKKNCNGNFFIDIYYQTELFGSPKELVLKMPYVAFRERIRPIVVDPLEWKEKCNPSFLSSILRFFFDDEDV